MTVQLYFYDGTTRVYHGIVSLETDRQVSLVELEAGTPAMPWYMLLRDVVRVVVL